MPARIIALFLLAALHGCRDELPEGRRVEVPPAGETPVEVRVARGDLIVLAAPMKPVHPDFAGAEIRAEYDETLLRLENRHVDRSMYGATVEYFDFRAAKTGEVDVVLRVVAPKATKEKSARYRVRID